MKFRKWQMSFEFQFIYIPIYILHIGTIFVMSYAVIESLNAYLNNAYSFYLSNNSFKNANYIHFFLR